MQDWHNKLRYLPSVFLITTVVPRTGTKGVCRIFSLATLKALLPSGLFRASPKLMLMQHKAKMAHVWVSAAHVHISIGELGSLLVGSAGKAGCSFLSCPGSLEFFSHSCCSFAVNAAQGRRCADGPQWWQLHGLGRLRIVRALIPVWNSLSGEHSNRPLFILWLSFCFVLGKCLFI